MDLISEKIKAENAKKSAKNFIKVADITKDGTKREAAQKFMNLMLFQKGNLINLKTEDVEKQEKYKFESDKMFQDISIFQNY